MALPKLMEYVSKALNSATAYISKAMGKEYVDNERENIKRASKFAAQINALSTESAFKTIRVNKALQDYIQGQRATFLWLNTFVLTDEFSKTPNSFQFQVRNSLREYKTLSNIIHRLASQAGV